MGEKVLLERRHYRLLHPCGTVLVTCCDKHGKPNIITLAWVAPASIQPPLAMIGVGKTRYSHNLIRGGEFVINIPTADLLEKVQYCGETSGRQVDKFKETGLTPKKAKFVKPPVIEECVGHLECRVVKEVPTGDHTLFIGEVLAAYVRPDLFKEDGWVIEKVDLLQHVGGDVFVIPKEVRLV